MIDVPVEVKDALREGAYKKNYRFKVFDLPSGGEYINVVTGWNGGGSEANGLTLSSPGKYKVYSSSPYFTLMFRSGTSYGGIMATDRDPVTGDFYVEHEFTYAPSTIWITYTSASYNVGVFTTYDYTIIDNNALVSESVSIDERMCSGDTLKFGLCEGSSLEFQYFDKPNITGKRIQAFVDVDYGADEPYTILMGFFDVKKCARQASTGIMKVTAYNKLMSEYLDVKANEILKSLFTYNARLTVMDIQSALLNDFKISEAEGEREPVFDPFGTRYYDLGTFHLTKTYGVDSFINPRVAPFAVNGFGLVAIGGYVTTADTTGRLEAVRGALPDISHSFDNWFREVIDGAKLDISYDTLFARMIANQVPYAWPVVSRSGSDGYSGYCNDVAYDYQVAHGITPTWHGMQNAWVSNGVFSIENIDAIGIYELGTNPEDAAIWLYTNSRTYYSKASGVANNEYEYYTDSAQHTAKSLGPSIEFADGTKWIDYPDTWEFSMIELYEYDSDHSADVVTVGRLNSLPDFTLREITSANYEIQCQFGQLSRETDLFSGVELNNGGLYPAEDLYPANDLYPSGASLSATKAMYSQLWADEGNVHKWRYLIITYKGLDGEGNEQDYALQRTVNADGTDDYNMSDNWLFRNLVWTAEQIGDYADAMVTKMQNNEWFPFEMWCAGLPYLETGDQIEIPLNGEVYKSYILQRQLKGIQNLQDTYINGTLDIF